MDFDGLNLISFIYATDPEILQALVLIMVQWLCGQLWKMMQSWLVNKAKSLVTSNEPPNGGGNMPPSGLSRVDRRRALRAAAAGASSTSSAAPSRLLGASHGERLRARSNRRR